LKWKDPDKCYDEIAMSFMQGKDIIALVEKGVDPERVAWCYSFERGDNGAIKLIEEGHKFFKRLDRYVGNVVETFTVPLGFKRQSRRLRQAKT